MSRKNKWSNTSQQLVTNTPTVAALQAQIQQMAVNTSDLVSRLGLAAQLGQSFDGKRDYYETLGYKKILRYEDYQNAYDRSDIAARIVDAPVDETWKRFPSIEEDNGQNDWSPFELAWRALSDRLNVPQYFELVDRVAGIGQYAVLLIGADDTTELKTPLEKVKGPDSVKYLSVYAQRQVNIIQLDTEPWSLRFGKPEMYEINFSPLYITQNALGSAIPSMGTFPVHYTRVIHVAEKSLGDGVIGTPRLQSVINRIQDLEKTVGGSAEMFWLAAWMGIIFEMDKDANFAPGGQQDAQDQVERFAHGLQRYARLKGIKAYTLGSNIPQPKESFDVIIDLIASATGIPKRILIGSERGELSSTQDEARWKERIVKRESTFVWPVIIRPFIDRLTTIGALPLPVKPIEPKWPNRFELSPAEKSAYNLARAQTLAAYTKTPELVVPPEVFVEEFLDLEPSIVAQAQQEAMNEPPLNEANPQVVKQFDQGKKAA